MQRLSAVLRVTEDDVLHRDTERQAYAHAALDSVTPNRLGMRLTNPP